MPVLTIECQLSQVQLKRYLAGEDLPEALLQDLQSHLQKCPECMAEAQRKRAELTGEPVPTPKVKRRRTPAPTAAVEASADGTETPARTSRLAFDFRKNGKTLALSGGLALVLIVMSTVMNDPTRLFGPKASEAAKAAKAAKAAPAADRPSEPTPPQEEPAADETVPVVMTEDPTPAPVDVAAKSETPTAVPPPAPSATAAPSKPEVREEPRMQESDIVVAETGRPVTRVPAPARSAAERPRSAPRRASNPAPRRTESGTGSIRVYDENGRPKN